MNKFFLLLLACTCLVSCNDKCAYTINGKVADGVAMGDSVYLQYIKDKMQYIVI